MCVEWDFNKKYITFENSMNENLQLFQNSNVKCKPFLRWAGGKRWLVKNISTYLPKEQFNRYHEPFLGGASIFFHLQAKNAFLSDLNKELVDTYIQVRDNVEDVIKELKKFENTEDCYYEVRSKKFRSENKKAARFIYLNQTSFNGIYRVNLKGEYNVPFGYRKKDFLEAENLRSVSKVLSNATIETLDFKSTIKNIQANDLVFLDPPYTVTHNNNGFIKYNDKLFDINAQHDLSDFIDEIKKRDAHYILTNAAHKEIEVIFKKNGDKFFKVKRASLIGGKNAKRGKYGEYIFTNIIK